LGYKLSASAAGPFLSIVIPVRNDAMALSQLLERLSALTPDDDLEIIVVDGGSSDDSTEVARGAGASVRQAPPGRGSQLAAGCRQASGQWIWMLHADSQISLAALTYIRSLSGAGWGRFNVQFDQPLPGLRLVALMMNLRSRGSGICTGDQGIFVHRFLLDRVGGVPEQPLMEDIELCRRLKRLCQPNCAKIGLVTAARRWRRRGLFITVLEMWSFRLRYWWGIDPVDLASEYYA
jgi:rSAM/selenodomain-associated transferase 2